MTGDFSFEAQVLKLLSDRSPYDAEELLSRLTTLPASVAVHLSRQSDGRRKFKKSASGHGRDLSAKSSSAKPSRVEEEEEEEKNEAEEENKAEEKKNVAEEEKAAEERRREERRRRRRMLYQMLYQTQEPMLYQMLYRVNRLFKCLEDGPTVNGGP